MGPNSAQDSRAYVDTSVELAKAVPRLIFKLAVELRDGPRLIGGCDLQVFSVPFRRARIGYTFHPEYWGRGFATEAARLLIAFGFGELQLHRIEAICDPRNAASARVLQKAGMTLEGKCRHDVLVRGTWRDSLLFGILDAQWREQAG